MKKSFRVLTMALAVALLVSVMPLAALALPTEFPVGSHFFHDSEGKRILDNYDFTTYSPFLNNNDKEMTITSDFFDPIVKCGDELYEYYGMEFNRNIWNGKNVKEGLKDSVTLKPDGLGDYLVENGLLYGVYGVHKHVVDPNSPYYFDNNLHWQNCIVCGGMVAHYHQDLDDNGTCDICKQPIVYRNVTVKQADGGKVEISKEKCMLTNRVAITVTPDEGYELSDIRGINNNDKHSVRPCIVDRKGSQYHLIVDVWDVEIQPTFVKSK